MAGAARLFCSSLSCRRKRDTSARRRGVWVWSWADLDFLSRQLDAVRLLLVRIDEFESHGCAAMASHEIDTLFKPQASERHTINLVDDEASRQPSLRCRRVRYDVHNPDHPHLLVESKDSPDPNHVLSGKCAMGWCTRIGNAHGIPRAGHCRWVDGNRERSGHSAVRRDRWEMSRNREVG